jgi:hypothetical protein
MVSHPWHDLPVTPDQFRQPPREYGMLPYQHFTFSLESETP